MILNLLITFCIVHVIGQVVSFGLNMFVLLGFLINFRDRLGDLPIPDQTKAEVSLFFFSGIALGWYGLKIAYEFHLTSKKYFEKLDKKAAEILAEELGEEEVGEE